VTPPPETSGDLRVRRGEPADYLAARRLLDAALLAVDGDRLRERLDRARPPVLLAVGDPGAGDGDERVDGVLVPADGTDPVAVRVEAIAVRHGRRGRGIGRALLEAAAEVAAERAPPGVDPRVTAAFDDRVRPFYEACGFGIERRDGRLWGTRMADEPAGTTGHEGRRSQRRS